MAGYLRAADTISGQEGKATMVYRDANGSNSTVEDLFYLENLDATVDINKSEMYAIGKRGAQNKPNGWSGSGSMTIYYVTSLFRKMVYKYAKEGVPTYFDITVVNKDPGSTIGTQTIVLKNCTLDSITLTKLDVQSDILDEDVSFTFDDFDILDEFAEPTLGTM